MIYKQLTYMFFADIFFFQRVKVNLRDDLRFTDVALKSATFQSTNRDDFVTKYSQTRVCDSYRKAPRKNKDYTRTIEESVRNFLLYLLFTLF